MNLVFVDQIYNFCDIEKRKIEKSKNNSKGFQVRY